MKGKTWSSRLSELQGVEYLPDGDVTEPPEEVRVAAPKALRYELGGEERISLQWTTPKGVTSASPAAQWFGQCYWKDATPAEILNSLYQGLERPGTPSDYHFAIQNAHEALWKCRKQAPGAVAAVESLCLLDLNLIEVYPDILQLERGDDVRYAAVVAFSRLIKLYERAGDIEAALGIALRASRFAQCRRDAERLKNKKRAISNEEDSESAR